MSADDVLWFREPASVWEEALPLGTGRLGAMAFGGVDTELVQLNDDRLWSGEPLPPADGDPAVVARARQLALAGDPVGAEALLKTVQGPDTARYLPLADLRLDVRTSGARTGYRRALDLRTGVYSVTYRAGEADVLREAVCHAGLHVLAWRVRGAADVAVRLSNALGGNGFTAGEVAGLSGATGMAYAVATTIDREGPDVVTVYVATEAGYRGPSAEPERDPAECARLATTRVEQAREFGWHRFREESVAAHRELFDRVHLDLGPAPEEPLDERIAARDPALAALSFHFGRYLLITSSRPGTLPANLQGIWNPHVDPPWRGNYTLNINLQMNYWPAETTGLPECHEPLLEFVEQLAAQGEHVARSLYGAPGWVAHHNSDPWCLATPVGAGTGDPAWANWPMAAAWLSLHLWEHFEFGGDVEWLRERAWPVLRGAAEFCAAWLVEHEGALTTAPSTSPENHYLAGGEPVAVGIGSTMDLTLTWELFDRLVAAAEVLGIEDDVVRKARNLLPRLPSPPIGSRGQLLEWADELPDAEPGHRHVSHLVGLHPGRRIDPQRSPELASAAGKALLERGDAGTGWSLAWKTALWARLGEGQRAGELLDLFLTDVTAKGGGGVYRNLFCAHPPFQIDGNFGITAAIAEMLLQSHVGELWLLPALPPAWRRGTVLGLRARGGLTVDLTWCEGELTAVALHGCPARRTVAVRYRDRRADVEVRPGVRQVLDGGLAEVPV
ncbi:glycoside hydrolase family 95 protein [Lentzea aerocolonigenes]|uniref:glycoside hydrolase family 95 protein n=1 Tax=Lentzea aerocolonigenes TaxID=68170 RepID=UPI0005611326|nr:glycoside hydrolase family 95 protein [Lentzea aerocolonigenes]MCP2245980.1 alpha-L-fucosidase 2 [Lentzea aerocolonigenes]